MTGAIPLRAPFPYFGDAMSYALAHVASGALSIDSEGRVWRSLVAARGVWRPVEPRRAENVGGKGYLRVSFGIPGTRKLAIVMAHNLVWVHMHGPITGGLEVNHKNLVRDDNRPGNLELLTPSGNIRHSYANGRPHPWSIARKKLGQWRDRPIFSDERVAALRLRRASGLLFRDLALEFGISITHAHRLCAEQRP